VIITKEHIGGDSIKSLEVIMLNKKIIEAIATTMIGVYGPVMIQKISKAIESDRAAYQRYQDQKTKDLVREALIEFKKEEEIERRRINARKRSEKARRRYEAKARELAEQRAKMKAGLDARIDTEVAEADKKNDDGEHGQY